MGGRNSKEGSWRQTPSFGSTSSSWSPQGYPQSPYDGSRSHSSQESYAPPLQQYAPSPNYGGSAPAQKKLERRYSRIADNYRSLEEVRLFA